MSYIGIKDFYLEIARGNVPGFSNVFVLGQNPDIDTATSEMVWPEGGDLQYLSAPETMEIASDSANDAAAGTGATSLFVAGVDGSFDAISEVVAMNGTTNVTTVNSYHRINTLAVLSAGTTLWNEGTIRATATTAGTVQSIITPAQSSSRTGFFTVPLGFTLYTLAVDFRATRTGGGQNPFVTVNSFSRDGSVVGSPFMLGFNVRLDTSVETRYSENFATYFPLAEKTDIYLSATTDTNNTDVRIILYQVLVSNQA